MDIWGRITNISGNKVTMSVEDAQELAMLSLYTSEERPQAVISIADERSISRVQRKKAYGAAVKIMDRFFRHRKVPLHRKIFKTQISA